MVFVNYKYISEADQYDESMLLRFSDWFDGRPAATFVILAGIGITLLKAGSFNPGRFHPLERPYSTILKRAAFLFLLGLLFSRVWYADILHFYGAYFVMSVFVVNASNLFLITLSAAALTFTLFLEIHYNFVTLPVIDSVWDPTFWTRRGFLEDLLANGCYPVFPWIIYFLTGIWLGRFNLSDCRLQKKIILVAILGIVISEVTAWLVVNYLITEWTLENIPLLTFFYETSPLSSSILSVFSASGTALIIIVVCMKLVKRFGSAGLLQPFLAMARMSLTLYIVHIGVFELALSLIDRVEHVPTLEDAWIWAAIFCLSAIPFAYWWVNHFGRGPFEKALRWVSK
jgi:uncharacterized membrane protein YeiB